MITRDQVIAAGGKPWQPTSGPERVYLNNWRTLIDLDIRHYKTGNISGASIGGQMISNTKARPYDVDAKVYWANGQITATGVYDSDTAVDIAVRVVAALNEQYQAEQHPAVTA